MRKITILGTAYPARYSLRAAISIEEKHGSLKRALFGGESTERKQLTESRTDVLLEMLKAGKLWAEREEGESTPAVPEREALLEAMLDGMSYKAARKLLDEMLAIIDADDESDFDAEAGEGKN